MLRQIKRLEIATVRWRKACCKTIHSRGTPLLMRTGECCMKWAIPAQKIPTSSSNFLEAGVDSYHERHAVAAMDK